MPDTRERTTRLERLSALLRESLEPVPGAEAAQRLGVTRQIIVHDVALLRAAGAPITSTPRGYRWSSPTTGLHRTVLSVRHEAARTRAELYALVDAGLTVEDVQVEHPVYGILTGSLQLFSRRDVDLFLEQVKRSRAPLLSSLTGGQHFHTVSYRRTEDLESAMAGLRAAGVLVLDA